MENRKYIWIFVLQNSFLKDWYQMGG